MSACSAHGVPAHVLHCADSSDANGPTAAAPPAAAAMSSAPSEASEFLDPVTTEVGVNLERRNSFEVGCRMALAVIRPACLLGLA